MDVYPLPRSARPLRSPPAMAGRSSSSPPSRPSRYSRATAIAIHVTALGVRQGQRFKPGTIPIALLVITGLVMMAYAWLAFAGLIPWWAR